VATLLRRRLIAADSGSFRIRLAVFDHYRRLVSTEQVTQVWLTGDAL